MGGRLKTFVAQSSYAQVTLDKPVLCGQLQTVQERLKEFGESVVWTSPSALEESDYVFYGNHETGAWTLVQIVNGVGCLVAFGEAGKRVRAAL